MHSYTTTNQQSHFTIIHFTARI